MQNVILFETKYWEVALAKDQRYLGRSKVTLKRPCERLSDLTNNEMLDYVDLVRRFEQSMTNTFGAEMFSWACLMNNAVKQGRKPQVHWHVRPRYRIPVRISDQIFEDPNFGEHHYRGEEYVRSINPEMLQQIANKFNT